MGTTLENGVYLPSEGERNCYAGLKTNWEILDQKVADVTALQQAVAGALHREIVESLPTTDIDPNTIYMVLSGTSATENVYNEFMYVNNAWELIGTSATDLTNYYTKAEVDGKLLLKANASDLTSHTGDTTIHVTASDKTKWTNSANTHVLRLALSALTPSTSDNSFSNLDDATALKVGDKVMDTAGVLFEVTAIDTQNSTFTIGSALIDLAQDSDVVHKSGDETVAGNKTFTNDVTVNNSNATVQADVPNLIFQNPLVERASTTLEGEQTINFTDKNNSNIASIQAKTYASGGISDLILTSYSEASDQSVKTTGIVIRRTPTTSKLHGYSDNITSLGETNRRWSRVYAMNYYYGNDNVEFSTKFVTTDTNQTISGVKTFNSDLYVANTDTTANTPNLTLRNYKADRGTTDSAVQTISFSDKNAKALTILESRRISNGNTATNILCYNTDTNNNTVSGGISIIKSPTDTNFAPSTDNAVTCGRSLAKWSDVQTYKVNGVEPSSLCLPNYSGRIDISSYVTNLSGTYNAYTPSVDGWIAIQSSDATFIRIADTGSGGLGNTVTSQTAGILTCMIPVRANRQNNIYIVCTTLTSAYFIPCQGNV